jgi:hypothetical protein
MPRGELGHLAGADQHGGLVLETVEDAAPARPRASQLIETDFAATPVSERTRLATVKERSKQRRRSWPRPASTARRNCSLTWPRI